MLPPLPPPPRFWRCARRTLEKTGGGSGLTTTPNDELTIPFTITATQALTSSQGYVAGTASFQNQGGSAMTITGFTINTGGGTPQTVVLSNCASTTVAAQSSAACSFNVTAPNAPAAGTVSATFTYTATGSSTTSTVSSQQTQYAFTGAAAINLGGTANLYDTIDTSSLNSIAGTVTGVQNTVRLSPADAAPPAAAPGVTLSGSKTFQYNIIIGRLLTCGSDRTVRFLGGCCCSCVLVCVCALQRRGVCASAYAGPAGTVCEAPGREGALASW